MAEVMSIAEKILRDAARKLRDAEIGRIRTYIRNTRRTVARQVYLDNFDTAKHELAHLETLVRELEETREADPLDYLSEMIDVVQRRTVVKVPRKTVRKTARRVR